MTTFWDGASSVAAGPLTAPNPWDTVFLSGKQLPGVCEVSVGSSRRVDEKKAAAGDGVVLAFHGRNPAKVDIRVRLWTADQLKTWDTVFAALWPQHGLVAGGTAGAREKVLAFDVSHPACAMHGIKSISIVAVEGPAPGKATGEKVMTLKCVEFLPPAKAATKPAKVFKSSAPVTAGLKGEPSTTPNRQNAPAPKPSQNPDVVNSPLPGAQKTNFKIEGNF
jgi:hypothetical protein